MAGSSNEQEKESGSGLARLRKAVVEHAEARAEKLVKAVEQKVTDLTRDLTEKAGEESPVARAGSRMLGGESPAKAAASEGGKQLGQVKDKTAGAVVGRAKDAMGKGGSSEEASGKIGDKKVTTIIETLDIGLPIRVCYDRWTEFEEFSSFMKGVTDASKEDDDVTSNWKLKVGPSNRSWKATVQEQIPDERISWTTEGDRATTQGVISFHELAPDLTRIVVVMEYTPSGFLEKTANFWRAQGRRVRLDLKHFQRYVTIGAEEDTEGWRGEIRDGEVVRSHEDALSEEKGEGGGDGEGRNQDRDEDDDRDDERQGNDDRGRESRGSR